MAIHRGMQNRSQHGKHSFHVQHIYRESLSYWRKFNIDIYVTRVATLCLCTVVYIKYMNLVEERSRSYCQRTQNHMTSNKMCVYIYIDTIVSFQWRNYTLVLYFMYKGEHKGMLNHFTLGIYF